MGKDATVNLERVRIYSDLLKNKRILLLTECFVRLNISQHGFQNRLLIICNRCKYHWKSCQAIVLRFSLFPAVLR